MTLQPAFKILLLASVLSMIASAQAPSFDCANAASPREKAVCADPQLATYDVQVAAAYRNQLTRLSPTASALVHSDQREWLEWLDRVCPTETTANGRTTTICLQNEYENRLTQLKQAQQTPGSPTFYTRAHFVVVQATNKADTDPFNPGFGTGSFSWQQIDNPTPEQAAWNKAILAAAISATADKDSNPHPTSFDSSADPTETISVSASAVAANDHLIVANLIQSTYGYGAAHPNTGEQKFSWWLHPGHELNPEDIFRKDSGWVDALIPIAYTKLKPTLADDNQFWKPDAIREAVAKELANPGAWLVTRAGLMVEFGLYEVAPYARGMPTLTLTWQELQPYLTPNLQIDTLPQPFPKRP